MEEPKHRLQKARAAAGHDSPSDAAKKLKHINVNTLISNENGNRPISKKMAQVYADAFNVTAGWLLYGENAIEDQKPVPLISWVSAGALAQPDYVPEGFDDVPYVQEPNLDPNGDWIALRVDGRSMDKVSPHDSIIFVNRNEKTLVPNALYIIGDGNGGATYKRFRPPNKFEAVTTKKDEYPDITFDQEPDIIGRVRKTILSF